MAVRTIEVRERVMARNDALAEGVRERLHSAGVVALNLVSSPGSGKTALLERTLEALDPELEIAVVTGDDVMPLLAQLRERILRRGRPMERRIESEYLHAVAEAYGDYFDSHPALPVLSVDIDRFDPMRRPSELQRLIERIANFRGPRESWEAPPTIRG